MSSIIKFEIDTALAIFQLGHAPLLLNKHPDKKEIAELCLKNLQHLSSQPKQVIQSINATSWAGINNAISVLKSGLKIETQEGALTYAEQVDKAAKLLLAKKS